MRYLPEDFSTQDTGMTAVHERKLEYFFEQNVVRRFDEYGYGHFVLACYAALPAVLTSDLLHKIWLNFKKYQLRGSAAVIHPVAPVDILLSSLVEEIGFELYEIPEPLRKALLRYVQYSTASSALNMFGFVPLTEIAAFLRDYSQFDFSSGGSADNAYRQAQEWTALSYLDPGKAIEKVVSAYQNSETKTEKVRYKDALDKMSARFTLNIVKDSASIPSGFQALNSLTSVVRDLMLNRSPVDMPQFRQLLLDGNELTDEPVKADNIINVEVPENVSVLVAAQTAHPVEPEGKVYALVVGVGTVWPTLSSDFGTMAGVNDAQLIIETLNGCFPSDRLQVHALLGEQATKDNIRYLLMEWSVLLSEKDELLIYISGNAIEQDGHCFIACYNSLPLERKAALDTWLMDDNMRYFTESIRCKRLILIVEAPFSGNGQWLPTSPDHLVMTAYGPYDPMPEMNTSAMINNQVLSCFTYSLSQCLRQYQGRISCRQLFVETLIFFEKMEQVKVLHGEQVRSRQCPKIFGHPVILNELFTSTGQPLAHLQTLLRQTGYLDKTSDGIWGEDTASALSHYIKTADLNSRLSKQEYIELLEKAYQAQTEKELPVFLLVFSDNNGKLPSVSIERDAIQKILEPYDGGVFDLIVLDDPGIAILNEVFINKEFRNRIQLFHYSGQDLDGDMALKDGVFTVFDFARVLDFQENFYLVIANTCRSMYFSEWLTQLGVRQAIGADGSIEDGFAADFGISIFRSLIEKGNLDSLSFATPSPYRTR